MMRFKAGNIILFRESPLSPHGFVGYSAPYRQRRLFIVNQATVTEPQEHNLTLPEMIDALVADGLIDAGPAAAFKQERRPGGGIAPLCLCCGSTKHEAL